METADTAVQVKKKRGRPRKTDPSTPLGNYIADEAKKSREQGKDKIVEKYYEIRGSKLSLIKRTKNGSIFKTFIGSTDDKKDGANVREFMNRMQKEGRLRVKV